MSLQTLISVGSSPLVLALLDGICTEVSWDKFVIRPNFDFYPDRVLVSLYDKFDIKNTTSIMIEISETTVVVASVIQPHQRGFGCSRSTTFSDFSNPAFFSQVGGEIYRRLNRLFRRTNELPQNSGDSMGIKSFCSS